MVRKQSQSKTKQVKPGGSQQPAPSYKSPQGNQVQLPRFSDRLPPTDHKRSITLPGSKLQLPRFKKMAEINPQLLQVDTTPPPQTPAAPLPEELQQPTTKRTPSRPRQSKRRSPNLSWVWLGMILLFSSLGVGAFLWLMRLPPLPDCEQISPLAPDSERLYCAREAAQSGELADLKAGLALVAEWSPDHPLYGEAQGLLENWSAALLAIAAREMQSSDLDSAVELANLVPANSPKYEEAQAAIAGWQNQWEQGEALYQTAQEAMKNRNWDLASEQVSALGKLDNEYWRRQRANDLTEQILTEKIAWQRFKEAEEVAKGNDTAKLGEAIALLQKVDADTFAWEEANAALERWSKVLLDRGIAEWQKGNLDAAMAIVQNVPARSEVALQAADLVRFSHAQKLATDYEPNWDPSLEQLVGISEALAAIRRIRPDSPFYDDAQTKMIEWQARLADLAQLQLADTVASLGQHVTFQWAIEQAQLVEADRPQRVQAQTLIAHWRSEQQRIEDRPYLQYAQHLAKPSTIPAYRAAIEEASRIEQGRALRIEAQTAIANWSNQIEILEDQPILDEALALARRGRLSEAIRTAQNIASDRALYAEAQSNIRDWQIEIQLVRDREIFYEAIALAERDSLTAAIDLASQIAPSSPLYSEVQASIEDWIVERDAIWEAWEAEEADPGYDDYSDDYSDSDSYEGYYDERYYDNSY